LDYLWHIILPVIALSISGFAMLTILVKNYFCEEMGKLYVQVARAKGLSEKTILYKHIFRNAMLIIVAGFPAMFISMLFTGSVLIEVIFSLDGMGLLGFNAVVNRDYPIVFGTLYIFSFIGLLLNILTDLMYTIIDPRISFEGKS
jgi:microcin C transport system permease protein